MRLALHIQCRGFTLGILLVGQAGAIEDVTFICFSLWAEKKNQEGFIMCHHFALPCSCSVEQPALPRAP